jgi:hypothetical protein
VLKSPVLKSKPCPCGKGMLNPWYFLICQKCGVEHSWRHDSEKVKEFLFVCPDYTESGCGCDELIVFSKRQPSTEASSSGPHVDVMCEKCEQLGYRCTKHKRRKDRWKNANRHSAPTAAALHVQALQTLVPSHNFSHMSSPGFLNHEVTSNGLCRCHRGCRRHQMRIQMLLERGIKRRKGIKKRKRIT